MGRVITAPGVLTNVQGQIDHVTDMYDDIKDNNLRPLTITLSPVTNANGAVSVTTEDDRITEDMKPVTLEVGTPEVFKAPVTVTTGAGTATLTCFNASGTSTVTVTFVKTSPVTGGADYPPAVTSTEFDILADRMGSLADLDTTDKSSIVNAVNELVSADTALNMAIANVTDATSTADILSSALTVTGTKVFKGNGGSYTGTLPNSIFRYATFLVTKRDSNIVVFAMAQSHIAINYYNGSVWSGWEEFAAKSDVQWKLFDTVTISSNGDASRGITVPTGANEWAIRVEEAAMLLPIANVSVMASGWISIGPYGTATVTGNHSGQNISISFRKTSDGSAIFGGRNMYVYYR